ncbi:MAG: hypothetical protein ACOH2H_21510 [Cypionkella sp.]
MLENLELIAGPAKTAGRRLLADSVQAPTRSLMLPGLLVLCATTGGTGWATGDAHGDDGDVRSSGSVDIIGKIIGTVPAPYILVSASGLGAGQVTAHNL